METNQLYGISVLAQLACFNNKRFNIFLVWLFPFMHFNKIKPNKNNWGCKKRVSSSKVESIAGSHFINMIWKEQVLISSCAAK